MKTALPLLLLAASLIAISNTGFAQSSSPVEEVVGTVRLKGASPCFDIRVRRALDSLVPKLATLDSAQIVKIDASTSWGTGREERVRNSFLLALEAQRYLRTRLSSRLNLFIAASPSRVAGEDAIIRVVSLPDSFSKVHVSTVGNRRP